MVSEFTIITFVVSTGGRIVAFVFLSHPISNKNIIKINNGIIKYFFMWLNYILLKMSAAANINVKMNLIVYSIFLS